MWHMINSWSDTKLVSSTLITYDKRTCNIEIANEKYTVWSVEKCTSEYKT